MFTPCHVQFNNIWGYPKHGDLGCHVILDNHIARSSIVSIVFHFASRGVTEWNLPLIRPRLVRGWKIALDKLDERWKSRALTRKPNQVWGCVFKIFGNYKLKCDETNVICARVIKMQLSSLWGLWFGTTACQVPLRRTRFFQLVPCCSWHYQPGKLSKALNAVQCTLYFEAERQQAAAQREGAGASGGRSLWVGFKGRQNLKSV